VDDSSHAGYQTTTSLEEEEAGLAIIRKNILDILFLTETKTTQHIASPILRQLGFTLIRGLLLA
jgi:hypothetical protein